MSRGHDLRQPSTLEPKTAKLDGNLHTKDSTHSSYEKYKASLHAIFDGRAPLPTHIREIAEIRDGANSVSDVGTPAKAMVEEKIPAAAAKSSRRLSPNQNPYSLFTEALKRASTHDEMRRAVEALQEANHPFPIDEDLLSKALTFPDENVVLELLAQLETLLDAQPVKNPRLLLSRLEDAAFLSRPGILRDRILKLKTKLKA